MSACETEYIVMMTLVCLKMLIFLLFPTDAPRSVSVSLSPSGNIVEGDSVTLTCSSDANPPATTYTWFKMKRAETFRMEGSGWRNQITNISSEFSGHYHCEAKNDIGASNSSAVLVDVHCGYYLL